MKAYIFDLNGFYVGETDAQIDPLETMSKKEIVYMVPAMATTKKPPVVSGGNVAMWNGSDWITVARPKSVKEKNKEAEDLAKKAEDDYKKSKEYNDIQAARSLIKTFDSSSASSVDDLKPFIDAIKVLI